MSGWLAFVVIVGAALVAGPAAASAGDAEGDQPVEVSVHRLKDGLYEIQGRFDAGASAAVAWAVLSDYENIPRFVPSMESSRVLRREADGPVVEQVSIGRVLFFHRRMRVVLKVMELAGREIRFEDVDGGSFGVYRGDWSVVPAPGGTAVTYRLVAKGAFAAPGFVAKGAARKLVRQLLESVRREMEGRARRS